jgi:DHA1 family bicyclomycin/chloramphenicol resistance-like MFS transporter
MTRGQIALLAGFTALTPIAIDMYLPALPLLASELGVTVHSAGQSVSIFLFGIAAGQLVAGPLSDRFGRRPLVLCGVGIFALAAIVAAMTQSFAVLLLARLAQAVGACAAMVSVRAVGRDRFDEEGSARFFSLLTLIGGMAPVLAPLLGAVIVRVGDWRLVFWVMAAFAGLLLLSGIAGLPESRSRETRRQAAGESPLVAFRVLLGQRALLVYLGATVFNSAAFFTYVANSSIVLVDGYDFTAMQFSLLFAVNSIALVASAQLNRILLKRLKADALLRISQRTAPLLGAALLVFALTQWGGLWMFCALLFLAMGSFAPVQANAMAAGLALDRLRAGSCAALFGAAGFAGGGAASWLASLLYDGTPRGLALVAGLSLAGVGLALGLAPGRRHGVAHIAVEHGPE